MANIFDRQIMRIALPAIVTNITVPLLGLVDTAIVGHMGAAGYIGAVAVGAMVFNLVYWVFGFLRMGTSGLTAQAYGRDDSSEMVSLLARSLWVALAVALLLLLVQQPLCSLLLRIIAPSDDVTPLVHTYYNIVVWGAPASLALFSLTGWFIGMQDTRRPMVVSIVQNVVNIVASLLLVVGMGMKIEGVALGTVVAQYAGLLTACLLMVSGYRHLPFRVRLPRWKELKPFLGVNRDIFLRTVCLVAVNLFFTSAGARQGATILAVNALLMQLFLLYSYFTDGLAYAGEALCGRYHGAGDNVSFVAVVKRLFLWGTVVALLFSAVYAVGGAPLLSVLTSEREVVAAAVGYLPWACVVPLAGMAAFVWDGVFIGITATRGMLAASATAAAVFFATVALLMPSTGNHGLWMAMILFLVIRGLVQTVLFARNRQLKKM